MNLDQRSVDNIATKFPSILRQLPKGRNNKKPVRIKYKGEYVMFANGKTVWAGMGPAKNAFNLHIERLFRWQFRYESNGTASGYKHYDTGVVVSAEEKVAYEAAAKQAILKDIEFVEVDKL